MRSEDYWKRRAERRMYEELETAEETAALIAKAYAKASRYLADKADRVFERFQTLEKLTEAEALQLIRSMDSIADMEELARKLEAIGTDEAMATLRRLRNTGAYGSRIKRLGEMLTQVDGLMTGLYRQDKAKVTGVLEAIAEDSFGKTMYDLQQRAGVGFSFSNVSEKQIKKVIDTSWSGKSFSQRIWGNTQKLGTSVKEQMVQGALTGKTEKEMAEALDTEFAKGSSVARRLVRTESCYVSSEMNAQAYEEAEVEIYMYLATLDLRTSTVCRELDGQRFKLSDRQPGTNCPPMHPWCRSTTIAVIDEEYLTTMKRRARNPETGETEKVPMSMTYEEWHKKYVEAEKNGTSKS